MSRIGCFTGMLFIVCAAARAGAGAASEEIKAPFDVFKVVEEVSRHSRDGEFLLDENLAYGPSGMTQSYPAIAFDGTNYLVVWEDHRCSFNDDLYATRVSSQGVVLDPGGILISTATVNQQRPSAAFDGTNYLVVWQDQRSDTGDIYGTRISTSGTVLDPSGIAVCAAPNGQMVPSLAFDGTDYLVVWEDARGSSFYDVYGARVSPSGAVLDPGGVAIAADPFHQRRPSVAFDGTNWLAVWEDARGGSYTDIYAARVDASGTVLDPAGIAVSSAPNDQGYASVAFDGANYLAVWKDGRSGYYTDVYGARVSPAGTVLDPSGITVCAAGGSQSDPSLAFDGTNFWVAWTDNRGGSYSDIFGARVDASGTVLDPSGVAVAAVSGIQGAPSVAFGGAHCMMAWHDTRDGDSWAVYGARVDSSGAVVDPNGVHVSVVPYNQYYPAVAFDGVNYLVVWQDYRSGKNHDIYGTRVSSTGKVLDPSGIAVCSAANWQGTPAVAFNGTSYWVVWTDMRQSGEIDIYGSRVDVTGAVLDPGGVAICTHNQLQMWPSVASSGSHCLVVWHDWRNYEYDVYGARVDDSGAVLDPGGIPVCIASGGQYYPAVASDGSGYLVVWHDSRTGNYAIYGARVDASGAVLDPGGFAVSKGGRFLPAVTFGGSNYMVTWNDYRYGNSDIFGARVTIGGAVLDPSGIAIAKGYFDQADSSVGFDGDGYVVTWQDYRSGSSYDIYGARVSTSGAKTDEFAVSLQFEDQIESALAAGQGKQMLVVFCGFAETIQGAPANTMRTWGKFHGNTLAADPLMLSAGAGGIIDFDLLAGAGKGGRNYILLGSVSGTHPGISLPGGAAALPLNWDAYTNAVIALINSPVFPNFLGVLDASGFAAAQMNSPPLPAGLVGVVMYYAYCLSLPFDFASNPVAIEITP